MSKLLALMPLVPAKASRLKTRASRFPRISLATFGDTWPLAIAETAC